MMPNPNLPNQCVLALHRLASTMIYGINLDNKTIPKPDLELRIGVEATKSLEQQIAPILVGVNNKGFRYLMSDLFVAALNTHKVARIYSWTLWDIKISI